MDILKVTLTALLSVAALFIITKIMGHKQVGQLDFFDYICGITIGSVAAELATELESPWKPLIALVVYGAVSVLLSFVTGRIPRARKYINGTPTILICGGKLYRENLKKAKLDLSELLMLCREQGYFDLDEIQTAIFEPNGKLSVLPRAESRPLTPGDVGVAVPPAHVGVELIMDGRIMEENLRRVGRDERWLRDKLRKGGYTVSHVLLAIYRPDQDNLELYPMNQKETASS